jgi:histidinol-phosphatase (PHP family)
MSGTAFVWETHGIHVGTGKDHIKHGIDQAEEVIDQAIERGWPALTFVIHTPRLTTFRYQSERNTRVKFIRGDHSYFNYSRRMAELKERYRGRIRLRYGIELEWQGSGLGLQWSRSKLFQASGVDFVIGSVHFSPEGIPYDGSTEDSRRLIELRGGLEPFWAGYLDEMIEMIDASWEMIHVVGHLDLPKMYAPLPPPMEDLDHSAHFLARRVSTLLEMIADLNLAVDLNLSGLRKGCGPFPGPPMLRKAAQLGIPLAIGSDCHAAEEIGRDYRAGIELAEQAGYRYYVSFARGLPEKRPLAGGRPEQFRILNLGIRMLNQRFERRQQLEVPRLSFGGKYRDLARIFPGATSLGDFDALRVRKDERSLTLNDRPPASDGRELTCLFSHHADRPGTLAVLFNTLASEEINVETAYLNSREDGTATAYLTLGGPPQRIREAVDFVLGTASDRFLSIEPGLRTKLPPFKPAPAYLLEVDGVELPIPISRHMVITVHQNRPGILLILLTALASRDVNVMDLQLGSRGDRGFAVLGIEGDERAVAEVLPRLGPQFHEVSHLVLSGFEDL